MAGVGDCGSVTLEQLAGESDSEVKLSANQVHAELTGKGNVLRSSAGSKQVSSTHLQF